MNEESNNIVPKNGTIDNTELEKTDNIKINETSVIPDPPSIDSAEKNFKPREDVSKVKIRTILRQRFKNSSPILKKIIPLVLVGIICFGLGLIAGRGIDRHRNERIFINRPGMYRQLPNGNFNGGNFNNKKFNNKNNKQQNNKIPPKATPPAATN